MKRFLFIITILIAFNTALAVERPSKTHETFFKGTDYELNIYRIYGRTEGKTMFILGGIQGDEPGGFLSADLYSELKLEKGNLIVIPRANFKSIILYDRGPDGDMNRRFIDEPGKLEMDKVVDIIKQLMSESDIFLNLHDGWGYHTPTYVDKWRNPYKFGQSVITDADVFKCDNGKELDLRTHAVQVVAETNEKIGDEQYFMHYFNTKTEESGTKFAEMRKTATYYALRTFCLPAYGIESSKNLPTTEMKILHHNYAVNAFMELYDIVPEAPTIFLRKPRLDYAVVSVNEEPRIVENGGTVVVHEGDICEITHIESNYDRGVSADVLGYGDLNDYRKKVELKDDSVIIFRKDNEKMGEIYLKTKKTNGTAHYFVFVVKRNGKKELVLSGTTMNVKVGDNIELLSAFSDASCGNEYPINVKGYVPPKVIRNNGDDRGYVIPMVKSAFMTKYSVNGNSSTYPVVVNHNGVELGSFMLHME
ncbi:MAG: M99 family carboxypeptidase catalytic domain-containing protein [Deferribacterales bacterium]